MLDFAKIPHQAAVLAPSKNVNHMVLSTSGQNLVLLEESEPNSLFIALTPLTTVSTLIKLIFQELQEHA